MAELSVEREVAAPPKVVWSVATDLDATVNTITSVTDVQRVSGEGFAVGTRWRETRLMYGREATQEMEVTAIEPGRSYTVEAEDRGVLYTSKLKVEPAGEERTRLVMTFDSRPSSAMGRVLAASVGRLLRGTVWKALARDVDDLAAAAERASR